MAAANQYSQKILFLLRHQADETIPDNLGVRPLWVAALVQKTTDNADGLRMLLGFRPDDAEIDDQLKQIEIGSNVNLPKRSTADTDVEPKSPWVWRGNTYCFAKWTVDRVARKHSINVQRLLCHAAELDDGDGFLTRKELEHAAQHIRNSGRPDRQLHEPLSVEAEETYEQLWMQEEALRHVMKTKVESNMDIKLGLKVSHPIHKDGTVEEVDDHNSRGTLC